VPNGVFPVPKFRPTPSSVGRRPSLAARVRTRWSRDRLDHELAHGADPDTSTDLGLRAAQLRSPAERARLANALVEALGDARGPNLGAFRLKTRRQHAAIRESADDLLALVLRLRDDQRISVRGAAMTARLLSDGASPLHRDSGKDLRQAIRAARFALDACGNTGSGGGSVGTVPEDIAAVVKEAGPPRPLPDATRRLVTRVAEALRGIAL
jgi:hypothetical protein